MAVAGRWSLYSAGDHHESRGVHDARAVEIHGIVIRMYFRDHPPSHFHAEHGGFEVTVELDSGVVTGSFPKSALNHLLAWYDLHRPELMNNWNLARQELPLLPIAPLE